MSQIVNAKHKSYITMVVKWQKCRDVVAGEDAIHAAGDKYLPMLKDQSAKDYESYVTRTPFYNATWRTIAGLVGMLFRKPPVVTADTGVTDLLKDVDLCGQPFTLFLQDVCENAITVGRVGVLVDYPVAPQGLTAADAIRLNLRPMMKLYRAESIINWRTGQVNNKTVLTFVVLEECGETLISEFETTEKPRWRVLDLVSVPVTPGSSASPVAYRQRVFEESQNSTKQNPIFIQVGADVYPTMGGKPLNYIPFVIMGVDDVGVSVDEPPLIDLVNLNLSHYRVSADYEHGCHFTGLPTLFLAGFTQDNPNDKIYIGSQAAIMSQNEGAKANFVEFSGQGLGALEKNLDRKEQQMAILGARMLEGQKTGVEAAETAGMHRKGEESLLSSMAIAISLGMTTALKWFSEWTLSKAEVGVKINNDFYPAPMTSQMLVALVGAWQNGAISDQVLFENLQDAEIIGGETKFEEEQARTFEKRFELSAQATQLNEGAQQ